MKNIPTDFDVDYEEKENSVFRIKKPKKVWTPGVNYFILVIEATVILIIFTVFFVIYNREWFGSLNAPKSYFNMIQSGGQYDCGDKYIEAESLKPTLLTDTDIKTKDLATLGEELKIEKITLEKEKVSVVDELSGLIYKNRVEDYNSRLEAYTIELQKHKKEIDEYNQKVQIYYDFLKENCTLVK